MIRLLLPVLVGVLALAWRTANSAEAEANVMGLKPGPGRTLVIANCIPCHSTAIIAANHLTREQWDRTITKMESVNGMRALTPEVRQQVLDYLGQTQRPADRDLDAGKQSPWATPLYQPNPLWSSTSEP